VTGRLARSRSRSAAVGPVSDVGKQVMFTGIIEELGSVIETTAHGGGRRIKIGANLVLDDIAPGASVAVNGCCLTAVEVGERWWAADAVPETLTRTTLGELRPDSRVNLERPLRVDGRLGGHIVQGHIDGVSRVLGIESLDDDSRLVDFELPAWALPHVVAKGSIAVDGVSLTIAELGPESFRIAVTPHTWGVTRFAVYEPGVAVNVEVDVVAKYVERLVSLGSNNITRGQDDD